MTWLSRLFVANTGTRHQAASIRCRSVRIAQRHRRISTVETLEDRVVLSNVTVTQLPNDQVVITGDAHNDQFSVTVNSLGYVTVVGTPNVHTTNSANTTDINGHNPGIAWTSLYPALGLTINLPGTSQNLDVVSLTGPGMTTRTQLKSVAVTVTGSPTSSPQLYFSTNNLYTASGPGSLTLTDSGWLNAIVSNSQLSSLTINAANGCCPDYVELDHDIVTGPVNVTEGWANGDGIVVDAGNSGPSTFGTTTLVQGSPSGGAMPGCYGTCDFVCVSNANLTNLTVTQPSGTSPVPWYTIGSGDKICVVNVEVSSQNSGISTFQGDGCNDCTYISSITTYGNPPQNSLGKGPDNITTVQGNGKCDTTTVDSSKVFGNICEVQGNGNFDVANLLGNCAGWTVTVYPPHGVPYVQDYYGNEFITQGDGYNDTANVSCGIENQGRPNVANNLVINQGSDLFTPGCTPGLGDVINVNCSYITSDMTLTQGYDDTNGAGLDLGNNIIRVATSERVFVGGSTTINEVGLNNADNTIFLGGINPPNTATSDATADFETGYLDVFTGLGDGAYVQIYNTADDYGLNGTFGPYNINGGPTDMSDTVVIDDFSSNFGAGITSQY